MTAESNDKNRELLRNVAEFIWEMIKTAITVVIVVYLIKTYIFQLFIVDGQSMEPTLHHNQMLLVDKLSYNFRDIDRGEIVVFEKPGATNTNFIKRIIALEGESVEIKDNKVIITGNEESSEFTLSETYLSPDAITTGNSSYTVGEGQIFVLGDNRTNSQDSRVIGPISTDLVVGKALFTYWPIQDAFWIFTPEYNLT